MLKFLLSSFIGIIALILYAVNLAFWVTVLFAVAIVRWLVPVKSFRQKAYKLMQKLPACWIDGNGVVLKLTTRMDWQIEGLEGLSEESWYFLVANHQSWADILILQKVFNHKIPTLKFFLKKQLIWLPFAGQACWLLDFPFMERPSKNFLKKHPHAKGKDIETTRRACEKFKQSPGTIISFLEGTRFSKAKQQQQQSPYQYLLKPKSSGFATALSALEGYIQTLIDVTIVYPSPSAKAWDFFCGRIKTIVVKVRILPLPPKFLGNFSEDRHMRVEFQQWINGMWEEKDNFIKNLIRHNYE